MLMEPRDHPIDKLYKRRDRFEIPDFQRQEVWSVAKKQLLIDSILRGWKLPKLYLLKTGDKTYDIVDGQQRLAAIFEFIAGDLELSKETAERFGGKTKYKELDEDDTDPFDDFRLEFDEIEDASDEEVREFFKRLQGGMQLNGPERLNAVPSELTNFARDLAQHVFFKEIVAFKDRRYSHFDVASKVAAIEVEGLDAGLRIDDLEVLYISQKSFSKESKVAKRIMAALEFLRKALGKENKNLRLRSVTQSIVNLAASLGRYGVTDAKGARFSKFVDHFMKNLAHQVDLGLKATDADYVAFQRTVNSNTKSGAQIRHSILLRKLFEFDPTLLTGIDATLLAEANLTSAIKSAAETIQSQTAEINELYAGHHGVNLFKPTNKTVAAQKAIEKSVQNADEFESLIEGLYFLLWEGAGDKIDPKPESFKRLNSLRTELQHDVDHGKASAFAKKKKAAADVLKLYAGVPSTSSASNEALQIGQLAILNDIRSDLEVIKSGLLP